MSMTARLLGTAFASADLLIELDDHQHVSFIAGANPLPNYNAAKEWRGKRFRERMDAESGMRFFDAMARLKPGQRTPALPVVIWFGDGMARRANVNAFLLPDLKPAVSVALNWTGPAMPATAIHAEPLPDADALMEKTRAAIEAGGKPVALEFVEAPGLGALTESNLKAAADIQALLQEASVDGASATRLNGDRFAVVRAVDDERDLAAEIREAGRKQGLALEVKTSRAAPDPSAAANLTLRAMRLALESCLKDGADAAGAAFTSRLADTVREAERFRAVVRARDFSLVYQPIVDLASDEAHHFEALTRFAAGGSPAETIRVAEEMGLIEGFDEAVLEKAIQQLKRFRDVTVAINVSGASMAGDSYITQLLTSTSANPHRRKRLMVEVTETVALADLEAADKRLRALRDAGIRTCLDDFGAGAASFN